jgi:hypothetical protein
LAWPKAHNIFLLESDHLGTSLLLCFWISCAYTGNFPSKAGRDEKYHMETVKTEKSSVQNKGLLRAQNRKIESFVIL